MTVDYERLPTTGFTRRNLRKFRLRNQEFDFWNYLTWNTARVSDDFMGNALSSLWVGTGGGGTAAAILANEPSGAVNLVTSASDNACSILYLGGGNVQANQNPVFAVRLKVSSIATGNVQIGFCDNIAAGVLTSTGVGPFVSPLTDPPTLVSTTSDAVAFTYDISSALASPSLWRLAFSNAGTPGLRVANVTTTTAIRAMSANVYQEIVIALKRTPAIANNIAIDVYVNGIKTHTTAGPAITGNVPLWPFILIGATSAVSRTLTVDYAHVFQDRDTTA